MRRAILYIFLLLGTLGLERATAATISLRQVAGGSQFSVELGAQLELEVVVDTEGENLTGYTFFIAFDADILRPVQQPGGANEDPFVAGGFLDGVVLLNQVEEVGGEFLLGYAEASGSGVPRQGVKGQGVAARLTLEVLRRPPGDRVSIRIEDRGHDRFSHYLGTANPGTELRFEAPLGEALVRVTGFRILPLPDLRLIENEAQVVFNLADFVEQVGAEIFWTHSVLSEIPTQINPETHAVTMSPQAGLHGERRMVFTALEQNEGLTAADTIDIRVISPPRIEAFQDRVVFEEDGTNQDLDLDAFVSDLDDERDSLIWSQAGNTGNVKVEISSGRIAMFSATPDWFGEEQVQFRVEDGDGLSASATTQVVVTPVNDPPEALRVDPVYPIEGSDPLVLPLSQLFQDKDDNPDNLQIELQNESGVRVQLEDDNLVVFGDEEGRSIVRYKVRDPAGAVASGRLVAVVLEQGSVIKPEIGALPVQYLKGGQVSTLMLGQYVRDHSSLPELNWSASADSGLAATLVGDALTIKRENPFVGTSGVELSVVDPQGNADEAVLEVHILPADENASPRIIGAGKVGLVSTDEAELNLDEMVNDPDNAATDITWQVVGETDLEIDIDETNRTLKVKSPAGLSGRKAFQLRATDPSGSVDMVEVSVLVVGEEGVPQIGLFPAVELENGVDQVEIDLDDYVFDDEDHDAELAWSAVAQRLLDVHIDPVSHVLTLRRGIDEGPPVTETQVLLRVRDTSGKEASEFLHVVLPPLFALAEMPDIEFFTGQMDSSLVLDDFVISGEEVPKLEWEGTPAQHLVVHIDEVDETTHRVHIRPVQETFQGIETLWFTATDTTGRRRTAAVQVRVRGTGLRPQISPFPRLEMRDGEVNTEIDLDDFVIDDDPSSLHQWSFSGQQSLVVELDRETHQVTLRAEGVEPGVEQIQFLVSDPANNVNMATLEIVILRGGEAPVISSLPQLVLPAGGGEERLGLSSFVSDPDTPVDQIVWEVFAEAGIGARVENSRLFVLVPNGQSGSRKLQLEARDPQGNLAVAELQILIMEDAEMPDLGLQIRRHPIFDELVELYIKSSETLRADPEVYVDDDLMGVENQGDENYLAIYQVPRIQGEQYVDINLSGFDLAGNEATRQQILGLHWMGEQGGSLSSADLKVRLNVAGAASEIGRPALLYRLDDREAPPGSAGEAVYAADLLGDGEMLHPVNINFFLGSSKAPEMGILRWNEELETWEEVATRVDEQTGWLAAAVHSLGIFKTGIVSADNRLSNAKLSNYPNPFAPAGGEKTQIIYELSGPGRVKVEVFNMLGQKVRVLVDEFQNVGTWSAVWDGNDENGHRVSSGMYLYELSENGKRYCRSMLLLR